jgi:hypothetical protein
VCTMCTTWAADRVVLRSDWAGFRMFSGVLSVCRGLNAVRVPPRAQCFRQAGGLLGASSLCTKLVLCWPDGPFVGDHFCGLMPLSLERAMFSGLLLLHGGAWSERHDMVGLGSGLRRLVLCFFSHDCSWCCPGRYCMTTGATSALLVLGTMGRRQLDLGMSRCQPSGAVLWFGPDAHIVCSVG